jgi:hypothetical protein
MTQWRNVVFENNTIVGVSSISTGNSVGTGPGGGFDHHIYHAKNAVRVSGCVRTPCVHVVRWVSGHAKHLRPGGCLCGCLCRRLRACRTHVNCLVLTAFFLAVCTHLRVEGGRPWSAHHQMVKYHRAFVSLFTLTRASLSHNRRPAAGC